jgi:hypothetical protein
LKAVLRRCGIEGLRDMIGRARTIAGRHIHPDAIGGTQDATYLKLSNAVTALLAEPDDFLADLVKRYKAGKKAELESPPVYQKPINQSGSILRDTLAMHQITHSHVVKTPITVRPLALEAGNALRAQTDAEKNGIRTRFNAAKIAAEVDAKAIRRQIDAAKQKIKEAKQAYEYALGHVEWVKREIRDENKKIAEAKKAGTAHSHAKVLEQRETHLPEAEQRLQEQAANKAAVKSAMDKLIAELELDFAAAKERERAKLAELAGQRAAEEAALTVKLETEKAAREALKTPFVLEPITNGIRYRRESKNPAECEWQVEPDVFLVGSFSYGAADFLKTYAYAPTVDSIGIALIGTADPGTGLTDPLPRVPIAETFLAGVEEFYSPLLYKDESMQRLLAAIDSRGTLCLLGYALRP